LNFNSVLF